MVAHLTFYTLQEKRGVIVPTTGYAIRPWEAPVN